MFNYNPSLDNNNENGTTIPWNSLRQSLTFPLEVSELSELTFEFWAFWVGAGGASEDDVPSYQNQTLFWFGGNSSALWVTPSDGIHADRGFGSGPQFKNRAIGDLKVFSNDELTETFSFQTFFSNARWTHWRVRMQRHEESVTASIVTVTDEEKRQVPDYPFDLKNVTFDWNWNDQMELTFGDISDERRSLVHSNWQWPGKLSQLRVWDRWLSDEELNDRMFTSVRGENLV